MYGTADQVNLSSREGLRFAFFKKDEGEWVNLRSMPTISRQRGRAL
jgi:hypothetical protein